jgi:hypothetical protein
MLDKTITYCMFVRIIGILILIRPIKDLDEKEQQELAAIRRASKTAETIYQLVQEFLQIVRTRQGEHLNSWMNTVRACHTQDR